MDDVARERRGRGRQAEARRNDQVLLDAARLVFALHGPEAPVSAVAAAAGVGIGSLYRRYAGKDELLQHLCQASMDQQIAAADAALAAGDDHWENLARFIRTCVSVRAGVFGLIAGTIPVTERMIASAERAHRLLDELVNRARQAGALRSDLSSSDIFELFALFSRHQPHDDEATQRLLAIALDGLRAPGRQTLPGSPPTWEATAQRWGYRRPATGSPVGIRPGSRPHPDRN